MISKILKPGLLLALSALAVNKASAKVVPAACLTDNMVLQQKTMATLWGKKTAGKSFTVVTSWNNKKYGATADANGEWKMKISTPVYGGPYSITFDDGEALTLKNILIGEVWICSGQSNMEMQLSGGYGDVFNVQQELTDAANYPEIRMFKVDNKISFSPLKDVPAKWGWNICDPKTVKDFSAAAYFFAKNIYDKKHVPIGIINSTWGGTVAEAWTSGEALKTMPDFAPFVKDAENGMTQEKIDARYKEELHTYINDLNKKDPAYEQGKLVWGAPGFDDSTWPKTTVPSYWQQAGAPGFNGTMWLRKTVIVPADWSGKDLKLDLGYIDDNDDSFFNGVAVGHTEMFFAHRIYTVPGNLVKAGENTIAIRVFDSGGLGGMYKGPMTLSTASDANKIDLAGQWAYHKAVDLKALPATPVQSNSPNRPMLIYNAMINPILPYTIKGVIWYQGESNASRPAQYRQLFPLMITDWRAKWGEGNFPFYFVQLANYGAPDNPAAEDWAALRDAQTSTLSVPNTGMAVIIDIGDAGRIHPQNKQDVGKRLALIALAKNYGENIPYNGPTYQASKVNGNKIEISFTHTDGGLTAKNGPDLKGFVIAGDDKKFHPATATIVGDKVVVTSTDVSNPVAVRYAWLKNPVCNLYNGAELPASPFRTDNWEGIKLPQ